MRRTMTRFRQLSWRSITWIQAALIADGPDWERWTLRGDSFSLTSVVGEAGIAPATTWRYRVVVLRLNEDESQAGALLREAGPCSLRSANPHGSRSLGCAPIASAPDHAGLMQRYLAVRSARHRYLWIGGPAGTRHLQNKNASRRIRRQSLVPIVAWIPRFECRHRSPDGKYENLWRQPARTLGYRESESSSSHDRS